MPLLRLLVTFLLAAFCLTGCIQADVGIDYASQTHGELVQRVRLSDRIDLKSETVQQWLQRVEQRSHQLGGQVQRPSERELTVAIPFNSGQDLSSKFNTFFGPDPQPEDDNQESLSPDLPQLKSTLQLVERNLLLVQRNEMQLDLDLRSLGVRSSSGTVLVSPGSLLDLTFHLSTPWGVKQVSSQPTPPQQEENNLVWTLKPGTMNHLETVFWVPNPLGIGTVAIVLLVVLGSTLRRILQEGRRREAG